jgi:Flp pilus assembly pilin Flp
MDGSKLVRFYRSEVGMSAGEYALLLAIIGTGVITLATAFRGSFSVWDASAAATGVVFGLAAVIRAVPRERPEKFFFGFLSGGSLCCLLLVAYAVAFNTPLLMELLKANALLLVGVLLWAAYATFQSLMNAMGFAPLAERLREAWWEG